MRDSGWQEADDDYVYANRTIGEYHLSASSSGEWRVYQFSTGTRDVARGTVERTRFIGTLDAAKRAAESALRTLCLDTLKALDAGSETP